MNELGRIQKFKIGLFFILSIIFKFSIPTHKRKVALKT